MEEILNQWTTIWERRIKHQDIMKKICFHNFLGAILPQSKRDLRVHCLIISDSGSGKSEAARLIKNILDSMEKKGVIMAAYSAAGIISSATKKSDGRIEIEKPYVEIMDWIGFDEAELIFQGTNYTEGILTTLQQVMDSGATFNKKLVSVDMQIKPISSIYLSSYYIEQIGETIFSRGLFQRMLCFVRELNAEETRKIEKAILEKYTTGKEEAKLNPEELLRFAEKIEDIISWYEGIDGIVWRNDSIIEKKLDVLHKKFRFGLNGTPSLEFHKIESVFSRRGIDILTRLSEHYAIIDKSKVVEDKHVILAEKLYRKCYLSIIGIALREMKQRKRGKIDILERARLEVKSILKKNGEITKTDLNERLGEELGRKSTRTIKILNWLTEEGLFSIRREGNTKFYSLKDK